MGVDGEAQVDRLLPLSIIASAAHEEVETAHADVLVRREIECATVGMQERRHLGALRVDRCPNVLRLAPTTVHVSLGAVDVGVAVSARHEIEFLAVAAYARLRLPTPRVDAFRQPLRHGPLAFVPFRHIEVATALTRPATTREVEFLAVGGDEGCAWVDVLREVGKGKQLWLGPLFAVPL